MNYKKSNLQTDRWNDKLDFAPYIYARIDDHWVQNTGKQMQFAVANPFTRLLPSGNMFMWKRLWSQDFQDEPWKILTGKQITMKLSSASSEFCGSTRSMSKLSE